MSYSRTKKIGFGAGVAAIVFVGFLATSGQYIQGPSITAITTSASSGLTGGCTSGACAITMLATCEVGERLGWDGSAWACRQPLNDYRSKRVEWNAEFLGGGSNIDTGPLALATGGAGAGTAITSTFTGRPGVVEMVAGSTTTGLSQYLTGNAAINFGDYTATTVEWTGGVPILSTAIEEYSVAIGFFDSGVDMADGCYFLYDRGNVASTGPNTGNAEKLSCWCASNSTRTKYLMDGSTVSDGTFTTVNAPVAAIPNVAGANIMTLRIVVTGSTRAEFYYNGTKSCEITSNIPTGSSRVSGAGFRITKSAGTTSRSLYVDRFRLAFDLTTARSP